MDDAAAARIRRLRWRARRGLLENDIVLARYLDANEGRLDERRVVGLDVLLDLTDRELLDLILCRTEPSGEADRSESREVLEDLRRI